MEAKIHCKVHYGDGGNDEEAELEEFYHYSSRYLIQLLDDPSLHHIYREQDILPCMASASNLGRENTTFWNPPPQLLDVLLDNKVVRMHRSQKASTSVQATVKAITNDQEMLMGSNFATHAPNCPLVSTIASTSNSCVLVPTVRLRKLSPCW